MQDRDPLDKCSVSALLQGVFQCSSMKGLPALQRRCSERICPTSCWLARESIPGIRGKAGPYERTRGCPREEQRLSYPPGVRSWVARQLILTVTQVNERRRTRARDDLDHRNDKSHIAWQMLKDRNKCRETRSLLGFLKTFSKSFAVKLAQARSSDERQRKRRRLFWTRRGAREAEHSGAGDTLVWGVYGYTETGENTY